MSVDKHVEKAVYKKFYLLINKKINFFSFFHQQNQNFFPQAMAFGKLKTTFVSAT